MRTDITTEGDPRPAIVQEFAAWTAIAALRSGRHMKSSTKLRRRLFRVDFKKVLECGPITQEEFDLWHQRSCLFLRDSGVRPVGWAAKLLNVYLKTLVYVGGFGHQTLAECIHPAIDNLLIGAVRDECKRGAVAIGPNLAGWTRIKDMRRYEDYKSLIDELRALTPGLKCRTGFELERFWHIQRIPEKRIRDRTMPEDCWGR